jgi:hypothetical protein
MRLHVSAKIALQTAGEIGGTRGSPLPLAVHNEGNHEHPPFESRMETDKPLFKK